MKLKNKVALVTGGSRGLGKAIAIALAAEGANVVVNYATNAGQAQAVVSSIEEFQGSAIALKADVTNEAEVEQLIAQIQQTYGRSVDVLVNNATGPQPMLAIEESTWQTYQEQIDFFIKAPFLLLKAILPELKREKAGRIINIGSEVVQLGNANFSSYVSAKSAMIGMTRSWANELASCGITVNLVAPGWIPVERHAETATAELQAYMNRVPLGHMGEPADIGAAVAFLASADAKFITGQCISVNGGNTFGI